MDDDITQLISTADISSLATSAKQDEIISGLISNNPWNGYGLYAMLDDNTTTYIEHQNTAGKWILQKITDATGITVYAKGDSEAGTAWTNRASQSYNDYDVTFS